MDTKGFLYSSVLYIVLIITLKQGKGKQVSIPRQLLTTLGGPRKAASGPCEWKPKEAKYFSHPQLDQHNYSVSWAAILGHIIVRRRVSLEKQNKIDYSSPRALPPLREHSESEMFLPVVSNPDGLKVRI